MSAYTTLNITRSKAKEIFIRHVLGQIHDSELEDHLDMILADRLYNVNIVPDHCEDNDDNKI